MRAERRRRRLPSARDGERSWCVIFVCVSLHGFGCVRGGRTVGRRRARRAVRVVSCSSPGPRRRGRASGGLMSIGEPVHCNRLDRSRGDVRTGIGSDDERAAHRRPRLAPQALACPSVTVCAAVDTDRREVKFDPTSSTPNATPFVIDIGTAASFTSIACPTATQCTAGHLTDASSRSPRRRGRPPRSSVRSPSRSRDRVSSHDAVHGRRPAQPGGHLRPDQREPEHRRPPAPGPRAIAPPGRMRSPARPATGAIGMALVQSSRGSRAW